MHYSKSLFGTSGHRRSAKFFVWLLIQHRLPTANVLARRHMQNDHWCPLCTNNPESAVHLFVECPYARHTWSLVATWVQHSNLNPINWTPRQRMADWWIDVFHSVSGLSGKGQASLIILTLWHIWKERNRRIFNIFDRSRRG